MVRPMTVNKYIIYVDDIILTENDGECLVDLKNKLASKFQIKDSRLLI